MYLWKMYLKSEEQTFSFTECTPEKEEAFRISDYDFKTDRSFEEDDPKIKDVIKAARKLCKELKINLNDSYVSIYRGFKELLIMEGIGLLIVKLDDGKVKVKTENEWTFTREEYNAVFDFVDVLIKHDLFF